MEYKTKTMLNKWALITTYKIVEPAEINFRLMETHINFYRKKWNVQKEILLIGLPKELHQKNNHFGKTIFDRIKKINHNIDYVIKKYDNINMDFLSNVTYYKSMFTDVIMYETNLSTKTSQWNSIKNILFNICDIELDTSYNKIINIDNDEFICLDRAANLKE